MSDVNEKEISTVEEAIEYLSVLDGGTKIIMDVKFIQDSPPPPVDPFCKTYTLSGISKPDMILIFNGIKIQAGDFDKKTKKYGINRRDAERIKKLFPETIRF